MESYRGERKEGKKLEGRVGVIALIGMLRKICGLWNVEGGDGVM